MAESYFYGTGRRKSAIARVFMKRGSGVIVVNGKPVDQFFSRETGRMIVRQPLALIEQLNGFDIKVNVIGGGESGQAGAVRSGWCGRPWRAAGAGLGPRLGAALAGAGRSACRLGPGWLGRGSARRDGLCRGTDVPADPGLSGAAKLVVSGGHARPAADGSVARYRFGNSAATGAGCHWRPDYGDFAHLVCPAGALLLCGETSATGQGSPLTKK